MMLLLFAICFLIDGCGGRYDPSLYPSYDVLNPGEEVRKNPLGFIQADGRALDEKGQILTDGTVVNTAFILWVYELKQHIQNLREELKKAKKGK